MVIQRLKIRNFRNYQALDLSLEPGVNILLGENGQGKTNLLEAIYLLCRGRSFRPGDVSTWLGQTGDSVAMVSGAIESHNGQHDEVKMTLEGKRRSFLLNGKRASRATLLARFPCVLFSPESLGAIKEGPDSRRQLVDDLLVSHAPRTAPLLDHYQKALRARNRWLRDGKKGLLSDHNEIHRVLDSLGPGFLDLAAQLVFARLEAMHAILPGLKQTMSELFPSANVDISVDYLISGESAFEWDAKKVYSALEKRAYELRNAEIDAGISLVGPQKHDIQFLFGGNDSRYFCSQGQQRGLILSFKMAQIMYHYTIHHEYPILLLDDVLSELDQEKRTNLIEALKGIRSQILVTTTDLSFPWDFGNRDLAVHQVVNGEIVKAVS